jgi:hypothetical protein
MYPIRERTSADLSRSDFPSKLTFPDVGEISPHMILIAVVFPAPFAPSNP